MKIHILGICGTFMGGIAQLAKAAGHSVTGSDQNVYPPMSTLLADADIVVRSGYTPENIPDDTELVIVGNALSRGNPAVEYVLNEKLPYISGPQWLGEHYLNQTTVLAVAGTHGKTTTTSMLAWILERAGENPGFLIGGAPQNFSASARAGSGRCFVVEADEYDTAFFDKRSKFVHYRPQIAVLNNLEFDHADIFANLAEIQKQFHHLVRTVPGQGAIIANAQYDALDEVLKMGCWSKHISFGTSGAHWRGAIVGDQLEITDPDGKQYQAAVAFRGQHNADNATAAIAAAVEYGISVDDAVAAMADFANVKRRLELLFDDGKVKVFDDFAHHPTAIAGTLQTLSAMDRDTILTAVLEPRSNSMRAGAHTESLPGALAEADEIMLLSETADWNPSRVLASLANRLEIFTDSDALLESLQRLIKDGRKRTIVFMSNGGFSGLPHRMAEWLSDD